MLDYKTELGKTLTLTLKTIKKSEKPVTRDELASLMNFSKRLATDALESLWESGLIIDARGTWRNDAKEKVFSKSAEWIVGINGINYLENHMSWWQRFWVRSVLTPVLVSFVTSLNAEHIWNAILHLAAITQSLIQPLQQ